MQSRFRMIFAVLAVFMTLVDAPAPLGTPGFQPTADAAKHGKKHGGKKKKKRVTTGTVEGVVLTHNGHPVAGARVRLAKRVHQHRAPRRRTSKVVNSHPHITRHTPAAVHHMALQAHATNSHIVRTSRPTMHVPAGKSAHKTSAIHGPPSIVLHHAPRGNNVHLHVTHSVTTKRRHHHHKAQHHGGAVTDHSGHFKLRAVKPGRHQVNATKHHGGNGAISTDVRKGQDAHVTIKLGVHKQISHARRGGNRHVRR